MKTEDLGGLRNFGVKTGDFWRVFEILGQKWGILGGLGNFGVKMGDFGGVFEIWG